MNASQSFCVVAVGLALAACGARAESERSPSAPEPAREPADQEPAGAEVGDLLLVVNKGAASVSFVDTRSLAVVTDVAVGEGPHEVAVSPDGALAVVTNYGTREAPGSTLTVLDVGAREALGTIDLGEHTRPHGVTWLPDGSEVLVTTEGSGHLLCVDPREGLHEGLHEGLDDEGLRDGPHEGDGSHERAQLGGVTCAIPTEQEISHMVAITPDGRRAFVANIGSGSITAIDVEAREALEIVETGEGAEGVAVSPDGQEVWVTNRAADTVTIVDVETLKPTAELASSSFPIRAHITADGGRVLVTNARSGTLSVFDRAQRELLAEVDMGVEAPERDDERILGHFEDTTLPIGVVSDATGERAFIAHALADLVSVLDLRTLETTATVDVGTEPDGMAHVPAR